MVGARTPDFCSYKAVREFFSKLSHLSADSPGLVGLESDRLPLLGADSVSALVRGFWDDDDWGRCGADFVRIRGFGSCDDIPPW